MFRHQRDQGSSDRAIFNRRQSIDKRGNTAKSAHKQRLHALTSSSHTHSSTSCKPVPQNAHNATNHPFDTTQCGAFPIAVSVATRHRDQSSTSPFRNGGVDAMFSQVVQIAQLTVSPDNAAIKQVQLSYQNIADHVRDT